MVPGCPDVLGRVDLIVDTGSELVVSDWKTARSRWSQEQAEDAAEQLILYSELGQGLRPWQAGDAGIRHPDEAKESAVDRHLMPVDPAQVHRTKRVVENVWRAIEAGSFYPAPSAMNCPRARSARPAENGRADRPSDRVARAAAVLGAWRELFLTLVLLIRLRPMHAGLAQPSCLRCPFPPPIAAQ